MVSKREILSFYKETSKWRYRSKVEKWENLTPIFNFLKLQPDDRLLDIGCGTGIFIQKCRKICQSFGVDPYPVRKSPYIFRAFAENLPFKNDSFSVVYLSKTFFLIDKKMVLKEIKKVLKPNGRLFIRELLYSRMWDEIINQVRSIVLRRKIPIDKNDKKIEKIIIQSLKKNGFKIKNIFKFQTRLIYPSQKLLIERFLYYSPLINLKKHTHPRIIKETIEQVIKRIYKKSRTTFYNNLLIEAIKNYDKTIAQAPH
jgi:ubiquinone/menaquinone biosynthesis C-methylase UbiE